MSELSIRLNWERSTPELTAGKIDNAHQVVFNDEYQIMADAAPSWGGNADYTNPEQTLAASLSSCHMMTFLALAAKAKWPVASYQDLAVAHLGKNKAGKMCVTKIELHPQVTFDAGSEYSHAEIDEMHERAHRYCFIANSLSDEVIIEIHLSEDAAS